MAIVLLAEYMISKSTQKINHERAINILKQRRQQANPLRQFLDHINQAKTAKPAIGTSKQSDVP